MALRIEDRIVIKEALFEILSKVKSLIAFQKAWDTKRAELHQLDSIYSNEEANAEINDILDEYLKAQEQAEFINSSGGLGYLKHKDGGDKSGYFGHAGRQGQVGGSLPTDSVTLSMVDDFLAKADIRKGDVVKVFGLRKDVLLTHLQNALEQGENWRGVFKSEEDYKKACELRDQMIADGVPDDNKDLIKLKRATMRYKWIKDAVKEIEEAGGVVEAKLEAQGKTEEEINAMLGAEEPKAEPQPETEPVKKEPHDMSKNDFGNVNYLRAFGGLANYMEYDKWRALPTFRDVNKERQFKKDFASGKYSDDDIKRLAEEYDKADDKKSLSDEVRLGKRFDMIAENFGGFDKIKDLARTFEANDREAETRLKSYKDNLNVDNRWEAVKDLVEGDSYYDADLVKSLLSYSEEGALIGDGKVNEMSPNVYNTDPNKYDEITASKMGKDLMNYIKTYENRTATMNSKLCKLINKLPASDIPLARYERVTDADFYKKLMQSKVGDTVNFEARSFSEGYNTAILGSMVNDRYDGDGSKGIVFRVVGKSKALQLAGISSFVGQGEFLLSGDYKIVAKHERSATQPMMFDIEINDKSDKA